MRRLLTGIVITALAVSPALADFHLMTRYPSHLNLPTSVVAIPSNNLDCQSIKEANSFLFETGANYPYASDFFKTDGQVCGVAMNFYRTTDQGASNSIFQDGGGLLGYCYPGDRKEFACNRGNGFSKATGVTHSFAEDNKVNGP